MAVVGKKREETETKEINTKQGEFKCSPLIERLTMTKTSLGMRGHFISLNSKFRSLKKNLMGQIPSANQYSFIDVKELHQFIPADNLPIADQ